MSDIRIETTAGDPCGGKDGAKGFDMWWEERSLPQKILLGIGMAILGIGLLALFGFFVMLLWNWLMPEIFDLPTVNYWQAWGLLILSSILFKNMGHGGSNGGSDRKRKKQLRKYIRESEATAGESAAGAGED
jgi:hypothetical protein